MRDGLFSAVRDLCVCNRTEVAGVQGATIPGLCERSASVSRHVLPVAHQVRALTEDEAH